MDWRIDNLFPLRNSFRHKDILAPDGVPPWEALAKIAGAIRDFLDGTGKDAVRGETLKEVSQQEAQDHEGNATERVLVVERAVRLKAPVIFHDLGIYIGEGTLLEPTAIIKASAIIGNHCEIRQGAYCRGNVIAGDHCTVGHATEIKNSIMMDHSEAGHFAYIGDSIIGSHVNLGAGTKLANLQFRSKKEKAEGKKSGRIRLKAGDEILDTGLRKLGAVIGDYCELGCNCVTSPGVILGQGSWVHPNATVAKGVYPPGARIAR
ncbi:MAG: glucose-1-phosphate thymidylyltransferase [Nitrospinae bacterium]|nr:glucose-1-phosphate thymidylyltransferase [Nitrospinota bacterium]